MLGLVQLMASKPETVIPVKLKTLELLKSNITSAEDAALFAQKVSNVSIYLTLIPFDPTLFRVSRRCASMPSKIRIQKMEHLEWP